MKIDPLSLLLGAVVVSAQVCYCQIARPVSPESEIERKSAALTEPDRDRIQDLTNSILQNHGVTGTIAEAISPLTKTVVDSEFQFHAGKIRPVKEDQVVQVVNGIAAKFNAPNYAYTNKSEVRSLRVRMALGEPHFIGRRSMKNPHYERDKTIVCSTTR